MAPPAPRRRSGLAEEPIESGEISDRRSLIIRSSPVVPIVADPRLARPSSVEVALEPPPMPVPVQTQPVPHALPSAPRKRYGWLFLVAGAIVAGAGAATLAVKPPVTTLNTETLKNTAALIGTTIDGEVRAVQVRAEAVATSSMLRAGIATDAQTLADMKRDKDVVFPVKDGETLEVLQIVDGKRTTLLRVPADASAVEAPPAGKNRLEARIGDVLAVTTSVNVPSPEPTITGEVSLTAPIDLAPIRQRLGDQVQEAVITGLAIPVVLVKSTGVKGNVVSFPIATSLGDAPLTFSAIVRPHVSTSQLPQIRLFAFGFAGLFALLFLVSLLRR